MIKMRLSEAAKVLHARRVGGDAEFLGCGTDSRSIGEGEMFVALRGPNFDGHRFIAAAIARGAVAAMIDRGDDVDLPAVVVDDTRRSLGCLSRSWRRRFSMPTIAVTGSNGKTTVKEMLAEILALEGPVLATRGNLNNDVGVPLTLLRLHGDYHYAVVELGANHPGEIASLGSLVSPQLAVITQCAPAHLEGFGNVEAVARAKGELIEQLDAQGIAVINSDDAYAELWRSLCGSRTCMSFGLSSSADVSATWFSENGHTRLVLLTPAGTAAVRMHLAGRHNVMNALAACATALALGVPLETVCRGLASVKPIKGRLQPVKGRNGMRIIDDSYNANPTSLGAGLEVLSQYAGEHWLVLGDMAELGPNSQRFHEEAGALARERGVARLYAVGELSRATVEAFGDGGRHFDNHEALIDELHAELASGTTVLVKGSRSMRMERVVEELKEGG